ncbi:MAG: acetoacetate decarboxylase family protein [Umezawaea sp.]
MDSEYPPEPWDLHGHGCVSLWRAQRDMLPPLPSGVRPVIAFGRAVVATAFVDYLPGSLLPYRELLAAVVVRDGLRVGLSITHIWVDSPASMAGGRELWGIPKELAELKVIPAPAFAATATGIAEAGHSSYGRGVPAPIAGSVFQALHGATVRTPVRMSGRVRVAKVGWTFATDGPLSWLEGLTPVLGLSVVSFRMRFGPR